MSYLIFTGDAVNLLFPANEDPTFIITPLPDIKFAASDFERLTVKGYRIIFNEDLARIRTTGVSYLSSAFPTKGNGILEFEWEHDTDKINNGGKKPLINASGLTGKWTFTVSVPATNPAGAVDPIVSYTGFYTVIGNLDLASKVSF